MTLWRRLIGLDRADPLHVGAAVREADHLVVLTGAGISARAGLPTFRGPDGLLSDRAPVPLPVAAADLELRFDDVCAFHNELARRTDVTAPTTAHRALAAEAEQRRATGRALTLLTLNGDDLHERAGTSAHHLHGTFLEARCTACGRVEPRAASGSPCRDCAAPMRPNSVLLGEDISGGSEFLARKALRSADAFLAVGVSGAASPVFDYVRAAQRRGAPTIVHTLRPGRDLRAVFDVALDLPADVVDLTLGRREPFRTASPSASPTRASAR